MDFSPSHTTNLERARKAVAAVRHFNELPEAVQNALASAAVFHRFHPSQIIYMEGEPATHLYVIRRLSERVLHYNHLVEDLSLRSVEGRLAHNLLQNVVYREGVLCAPRRDWTTFDEMAVRLGTVRDVLSRALHTLKEEGLLRVERRQIVILDFEGLHNPVARPAGFVPLRL